MSKPLSKSINLKPIVDMRGKLIFAEAEKDIPFIIKRFFCLYDITESAVRGDHAHKNTRLVLYCLSGTCTVVLDNGQKTQSIRLSHPHEGLLIEPLIWHRIEKCSKGTVVLTLASEHFDESDYVRNYKEFKKYISKCN